jgi:hypothetical protein
MLHALMLQALRPQALPRQACRLARPKAEAVLEGVRAQEVVEAQAREVEGAQRWEGKWPWIVRASGSQTTSKARSKWPQHTNPQTHVQTSGSGLAGADRPG